MIRLLHFSDVHVQEPVTAMPATELIGKRLLAAGNLWLKRGRLFRDVPRKLEALAEFARAQEVHLSLCTGDYTALGSEAEYAAARRATEPLFKLPLGVCTVPGNHDLYLADAVRHARFERHFGDVLRTDWPERARDGGYPFVRLIGEHLAVVGVNSAKPNPNPFSSAGLIPDAQLQALDAILSDPRVAQRWCLVMTHYGILRADGRPDSAHHGLANGAELLRVCARPNVVLIHGHIHHRYHHPPSDGRPWMFCAGSATHRGREGLWLFEAQGRHLRAVPGAWTGAEYALDPAKAVEIGSPC